MKHSYGLQLFSVRDAAETDLLDAIRKVAEIGYEYVEFAGFYGHSAADVRRTMDECGIKCSGTHTGYGELRPEVLDATIEYHKTIGNQNIIIPGAELWTLDNIAEFCDVVNNAIPILKKEGINVGYHNHSHEFEVRSWGSTIHAELERRTDLAFEIDTYWIFNAGCDPIKVLKRLENRLCAIHLKDGIPGESGKALGEGYAPVKKIRDVAYEMGLPIVVESETLDPDGISEVARCMEFLKSID